MEDPQSVSNLMPHEENKALSQPTRDSIGNAEVFKDIELKAAEKKSSYGVAIAWDSIDLTVPNRGTGEPFQILKKVSGVAKPGRVLAVMGPSGAGKTTLVEVLASQMVPTAGKVTFNGHPWDPKMSRLFAYCHQLELFRPNLMVEEHLYINAKLRMDANSSEGEIRERIEEVMTRLGLLKSRNTLIGAPGIGGISGGERKRLNVATEILNRPSVIFLDEPTSGLDSFLAANLMAMLKDISKGYGKNSNPVTVVAIVHQPSSEVFNQMEDLMLLANGRTAYFGSASGLVNYSKSVDRHIPEFTNPVDHFINSISTDPDRVAESKKQTEAMLDLWAESKSNREVIGIVKKETDEKEFQRISPKPVRSPSMCMQLGVLLSREFIDRRRNKFLAASLIIRTLVFFLFLGSIFYRVGSDVDQDSITNVVGALFFIMINQAFTFVIPTVQTFPKELVLFRREHKAGIYGLVPYYLSKVFANLPFDVAISVIFTPIVFYMIDFNDDPNVYGGFVGVLVLMTLFATALGYWVSSMAPNADLALVIGIVFVVFPIIPSGFILRIDAVPIWYIWLREASPFTWAFRVLMINQWNDFGPISCSSDDIDNGRCSEDGGRRVFDDGRAVLRQFGIKKQDEINAPIVLSCLVVAYHIAAIISLMIKTRVTERSLSK